LYKQPDATYSADLPDSTSSYVALPNAGGQARVHVLTAGYLVKWYDSGNALLATSRADDDDQATYNYGTGTAPTNFQIGFFDAIDESFVSLATGTLATFTASWSISSFSGTTAPGAQVKLEDFNGGLVMDTIADGSGNWIMSSPSLGQGVVLSSYTSGQSISLYRQPDNTFTIAETLFTTDPNFNVGVIDSVLNISGTPGYKIQVYANYSGQEFPQQMGPDFYIGANGTLQVDPALYSKTPSDLVRVEELSFVGGWTMYRQADGFWSLTPPA
jgi:hypothetical protein